MYIISYYRSVDCMAIASHKDGTYTVTWVPTSAGSYDVRVSIDGSVAGKVL